MKPEPFWSVDRVARWIRQNWLSVGVTWVLLFLGVSLMGVPEAFASPIAVVLALLTHRYVFRVVRRLLPEGEVRVEIGPAKRASKPPKRKRTRKPKRVDVPEIPEIPRVPRPPKPPPRPRFDELDEWEAETEEWFAEVDAGFHDDMLKKKKR